MVEWLKTVELPPTAKWLAHRRHLGLWILAAYGTVVLPSRGIFHVDCASFFVHSNGGDFGEIKGRSYAFLDFAASTSRSNS